MLAGDGIGVGRCSRAACAAVRRAIATRKDWSGRIYWSVGVGVGYAREVVEAIIFYPQVTYSVFTHPIESTFSPPAQAAQNLEKSTICIFSYLPGCCSNSCRFCTRNTALKKDVASADDRP